MAVERSEGSPVASKHPEKPCTRSLSPAITGGEAWELHAAVVDWN